MKKFYHDSAKVEGDISTKNPSLYTKVESQSLIMVKGKDKDYQDQLFESLISEL